MSEHTESDTLPATLTPPAFFGTNGTRRTARVVSNVPPSRPTAPLYAMSSLSLGVNLNGYCSLMCLSPLAMITTSNCPSLSFEYEPAGFSSTE